MKAGTANLEIISTHSSFEKPRFWADVECIDPEWDGEIRRIEIHRDVAYFIFKQREMIEDLLRQLSSENSGTDGSRQD